MLTKPEPHPNEIVLVRFRPDGTSARGAKAIEYDDGLWSSAAPILIASYTAAFLIAVLTFKGSGEAFFAVVISIGFAVMFFAIPILLVRIRNRRDPRWRTDEAHRSSEMVSTFTGPMHRREAVFHIVMPHLVVPALFAAFAVIRFLVGL